MKIRTFPSSRILTSLFTLHLCGKRTIRVKIPYRNIIKLEALTKNVLLIHQGMGAGSPLNNNVDVAAIESIYNLYLSHRSTALQAHKDGVALTEQANRALGADKGQNKNTEGTVYYLLCMISDRLLFVYHGSEEELSTFGFQVVKRVALFRKKKPLPNNIEEDVDEEL